MITYLNNNWTFRQEKTTNYLKAEVPGCIHSDLIKNNLIDEPFYRSNEKTQQWISEKDWEYKTNFNIDENLLSQQNIYLYFEGLDTYSKIFLNDELLLTTNNAFVLWKVNCKNKLLIGKNNLKIIFKSVFKENLPKWHSTPFRLEACESNDQSDIRINMYSRKPGFHFGWDWGPRLITSGIWKDVYISTWNHININNIQLKQININKNLAKLNSIIDIDSTNECTYIFQIKVENELLYSTSQTLNKGNNKISLDFGIENPKLWWTNGLGKQNLYNLNFQIFFENDLKAQKLERIGLKTLKLIQKNDSFGKSFYFELNGIPIFIKGSNYIPQDSFQTRVKKENYEHIIKSAKKANMNMLRVWGGGIYENNIFYDLCDENGLLVWQDMMFACAMYPSNKEFLDSIKKEISDNIIRIRNNTCIAIYCGNNECESAWNDWGWKDKYSKEDAKNYEKNYKNLFYQLIPEVLQKVDPTRNYINSSPIAGFKKEHLGDTHYWGVWHGKEDFTEFKNNISRFVSEFGFQSYPIFSSVKNFTLPKDWDLKSEVMYAHQRCTPKLSDKDYGNRLINHYLENHFKTPKNFECYLYVSQILQAEGVKKGIEVYRQNMKDKYCMGTLYWQINDCWPAASWSSIDYYGNWKALHYYVKDSYKPIIITFESLCDSINIHLVSDSIERKKALLSLKLIDFSGNCLKEESLDVDIKSNTSYIIHSVKKSDLLKSSKGNRDILLYCSLVDSKNNIIAKNIFYLDRLKNLNLLKPTISTNIIKSNNNYIIKLISDKLAKNVYLEFENLQGYFSNNFFDLLPNNEIEILYKKTNTIENKNSSNVRLKIITLYDSYTN